MTTSIPKFNIGDVVFTTTKGYLVVSTVKALRYMPSHKTWWYFLDKFSDYLEKELQPYIHGLPIIDGKQIQGTKTGRTDGTVTHGSNKPKSDRPFPRFGLGETVYVTIDSMQSVEKISSVRYDDSQFYNCFVYELLNREGVWFREPSITKHPQSH